MKKSEFLRELRYNLMGKISDDELENIIMDYDEIFESGKAENKTEDEISDMIGSPAMVAKTILDEWPNDGTSKSSPESSYPIAPLGKRVVAFIIDYILSLIPLVLLLIGKTPESVILLTSPIMMYNPMVLVFLISRAFILNHSASAGSGVILSYTEPGINAVHIVLTLACFVFFWLYSTLCMIIMKDRTIGMRLMNIKVVKRDRTALRPIDVFVRQFIGKVLLATMTSSLSYIISFFWAVFSKTNNTVHDKLAGTLVVEDIREKTRG
ncbi:RDD family protein [Caldicoprobacter algeriensis]|uniref:RDD family protein n=1 Tax=Caldicoprobacter algeriensis TaxID=699281 RepID=UPI00207A5F14|nr:RDD family protein [Caldicoprobacter algeriensis]MCM8900038.1 RDD family protein [Caldicoprobacter algeriensis]